MTPALKAMVEAMAAELRRQACDDDGTQSFPAAGALNEAGHIGYDGLIDLEKVAWAGPAAIKPDLQAVIGSAYLELSNGEPNDALGASAAALDEILKETP